jgi:PAS domain S-box-containing protein
MKTATENAILRNLVAEALRVYDPECGLPSAPAARPRAREYGALGSSDLETENAVLRNLLSATAEAYENRLQAFRAEKELVRHVLAATRDAVLTTDPSGSVTSLNPAAVELTGRSPEEARGRSLAEVLKLAGGDGAAVTLDLAPCLAEGRRLELPPGLGVVRRDGRTRAVEGSAAAIHDRLGGVLGVVVILCPGAAPAPPRPDR